MWKWFAAAAGVAALVVLVAVGLGQTETAQSTSSRYATPEEAAAPLDDAPPPLAAVYDQPSEIVEGDLRDRLRALRGRPVVVNKWASWCGPCRAEFPFFQQVTAEFGDEVAFLGLNSGDNADDARAFLERFPVAYPSYEDPRERVATAIGAAAAYPVTVFYDREGERTYVHQGGYLSVEQLRADVERYAR